MTWTLIILCFVNSILDLAYGIYRKAEGIAALFAVLGLATLLVAAGFTMKLILG